MITLYQPDYPSIFNLMLHGLIVATAGPVIAQSRSAKLPKSASAKVYRGIVACMLINTERLHHKQIAILSNVVRPYSI